MKPCFYCGEQPPSGDDIQELLDWQDVHLPYQTPAHRKCTDDCENDAVAYLNARARAS